MMIRDSQESHQNMIIWIVVLSFMVSVSHSQLESCFVKGECLSSIHVAGKVTEDENDCLSLCKNTKDCEWFTFYPDASFCQLFENCVTLSDEVCPGCVSGENECEIPDPICFAKGECDGVVIATTPFISTSSECLSLCQKMDKCSWFTHFPLASICVLLESCEVLDESCGEVDDCTSGESVCELESSWHLTVGGYVGSDLQSVELFNWKTGAQCYIEALPQAMGFPSGTLINGDPLVCGGRNQSNNRDVKCFQYQRDNKIWKRVSDLLAPVFLASSVQIEGQGWFLFGGRQSNLETSQKLVGIDSKWEAGPPVIEKSIEGQCAVKINSSVTAFIGGNQGNERNIYLYDWSSDQPSFVLQDEKLIKNRVGSVCGLIKGKDGLPVVVIIGGNEKGMELWNPRKGEIKPLEIPAEVGGSSSLHYAQMIPVKDESELIIYGGYGAGFRDEIWNYNGETNIWTKIGELLDKRDGHVTLPVFGIEC